MRFLAVLWLISTVLVVAHAPAHAAARNGDPLAVTAEMQRWATGVVRGRRGDVERMRALHAVLAGRGPRSIRETTALTPSAIEAFASRRADCVGFAMLLVGLARTAGVDAGFALEAGAPRLDRSGGLSVRRGHLVAVAGDRVFDLGGERPLEAGVHEPVSRRTAVALYHSNRGVQRLTRGDADGAVEWLWRALRSDPSLGVAWTNLGVALRRAGDPTGAVLAHEMALLIDPADASARTNLAIARSGAQE